jgi:hypothetical protein
MPLLSQKEVLNLKLSCIKAPQLRILASNLGISNKGTSTEIVKRILGKQQDENIINEFIRQRYAEGIQERRSIISDKDLRKE